MKWFPLVALLLAGCGGKIITPYNFQVKDTLKGSPELIIKWPEHGRGQQSIHIMLKGSTRLYTTPILLHITIADDYQFTLCNPFVKRYYEIPFRLFSPPVVGAHHGNDVSCQRVRYLRLPVPWREARR